MKLQSFKCHKVVRAAAIQYITSDENNVYVALETEPDVQHPLDPLTINRHLPVKGDYLVKDDNGYFSFLHKEVFEADNSLLDE